MSRALDGLKTIRLRYENMYNNEIRMARKLGEQIPTKDQPFFGFRDVEEALTPPTKEEVCKALSEYYGQKVEHDYSGFWVYDLKNQNTWGEQSRLVSLDEIYDKPHLITLIGRFYEGLDDEN